MLIVVIKKCATFVPIKTITTMMTAVKTQIPRPSDRVMTSATRKSKTAIFWEKNPTGIIKVNDRRAVNK